MVLLVIQSEPHGEPLDIQIVKFTGFGAGVRDNERKGDALKVGEINHVRSALLEEKSLRFLFSQSSLLGFDFVELGAGLGIPLASFPREIAAVGGELRRTIIEAAQNVLLA